MTHSPLPLQQIMLQHQAPIATDRGLKAILAGTERDQYLAGIPAPVTSSSRSMLDVIRWELEQLPQGFPEVSREHIMRNLPLTVLALPGVHMCTQAQINPLNQYLATAAFRYAMIQPSGMKVDVGNGGLKHIPYALNPLVEYSEAGKMLHFMKNPDPHPEMFRRQVVLQNLEWIIWQSKK